MRKSLLSHARKAKKLLLSRRGLGAPYMPASESCTVLDTQVPDSMEFETHLALLKIKNDVGGSLNEYVMDRLHYHTNIELCKALAAEQIDAVAMAIYNIEYKGQGMIIGDQTGIGKGRVAASMIRYGHYQGLKPIFITEKPNLFTDIYRDLAAIGSAHLVPFIINSKDTKTNVKDENGEIIYKALHASGQAAIFETGVIPAGYDYVMTTYSQFTSPKKYPVKPAYLSSIARDNIMILDESHNASGESNVGEYLKGVVASTRGVTFLSATFAKRPDNMPIYAMKTAISEANMEPEDLVYAIANGGVAMQEILASQLVKEGQMLRRERSSEGVIVKYITLEQQEKQHRQTADKITDILQDIIEFQLTDLKKKYEELDEIAVAKGKQVTKREGTNKAGVDSPPFFSKVFNVVNQMLFSLKAEAVADDAIQQLREGRKPVIAFSSTMESFISDMLAESDTNPGNGELINVDFSEVLMRGLNGILRYTEYNEMGKSEHKMLELNSLGADVRAKYETIRDKIKRVSIGLAISPIDIIVQKIRAAGFTTAEVTGRDIEIQINTRTMQGVVMKRKKINTNDAFREFNNNEVDCLLINQSGSTGASAQAMITSKVSREKVKQRVMIVLQMELDINREVQKRGRIDRTGQIMKPIYHYLSSAIPAERRLMMMLQKKLKSLDANTTSNQKQSKNILDVEDFLNKYGDKIVTEYLLENPKINRILDDPLFIARDEKTDVEKDILENAASKVSGRVAVLSCTMQEKFYTEISQRYREYVEYLKQIGEYDLEVETMNLQAELIKRETLKAGNGGESAFGEDSYIDTVNANVLKKPFTQNELQKLLSDELKGKSPKALQTQIIKQFEVFTEQKLKELNLLIGQEYEKLTKNVRNEKRIKNIKDSREKEKAIAERTAQLQEAREKELITNKEGSDNKADVIKRILSFFYTGRGVHYPVSSYEGGTRHVKAIFIGFSIDIKRPNPYAPSAIRLKFAFTDSNKYVALSGSYKDVINGTIVASMNFSEQQQGEIYKDWPELIKQNSVNRKIRYIVTGNILQAASDFRGKLISYTTNNPGEVLKGILMPEDWSPKGKVDGRVIVPVTRAYKIIASLTPGNMVQTKDGISLVKLDYDKYRIIVSRSRKRGGDVYLHPEILPLIKDGNFNLVGDDMRAELPAGNLENFLNVIHGNFRSSLTVSAEQFELIKDIKSKTIRRNPIPLPKKNRISPPSSNGSEDILIRAQAAKAKLLLLRLRKRKLQTI
jgi:hypothetical protein